MAYIPCILIGLGGTGTAVVEMVRQHVLSATKNDPQLREQLVDGLFQFVAVDTMATVRDRGKMPPENYHAATVSDGTAFAKGLVDEEPFFRTWYYMPPNWPTFYKAGSITLGAGTVPLKGRLAYHSDVMRSGDTFERKLEAALGRARDVWGPQMVEGDLILVYLVGSLCGGTGSGLFLSVAHHTRSYLPEAKIIAVQATASVLNLVAKDRDHIGANCCAGLNSLDLWLDPNEQDQGQYTPFHSRRDGKVEGTTEAPIDVCYLITKWTSRHLAIAIDDHRSYLRLMADGIFSEIMGPASDDAQARFVDWLGMMTDVPLHHDRPVHYGSFGVSGMRYDVDRITEYLAMRFSRMVLDAWFLSPADSSRTVADLARGFIASARIRQREGHDDVLDALVNPRDEMIPPAPSDIRDSLMHADSGDVVSVVKEFEQALLKQLGLERKGAEDDYVTLADVMRANADELYERTVEAADQQVAELLRGSDDGFEVARNFVEDLRAEIETNREEIRVECDGDKGRQKLGYEDDINELQLKKDEKLDAMLEARSMRQGARKREFIEEWWEPWENAMTQLVIRRRAVEFYTKVLRYLGVLSDGFGRMGKILTELRDEFLRGGPGILGQRKGKGAYVLEEAILDTAAAVERRFLQDKEFAPGYGSESLLGGEEGVIADLVFLWGLLGAERKQEASAHEKRIKDELRDLILERGRREFREGVSALSLWDALELEANQAGHTAATAIKKYVEDKVRECAGRCSPAWRIDVEKATAQGLVQAYHGELTFSEEALGRFATKYGDIDLVALTGAQATPIPTVDPHSLMMRLVEGRAPLYLQRESKDLVDAYNRFRNRSSDVPLYVDVRYEDLPMRLLEPEREEGRLTLLLAEFLGSQFPTTKLGQELQTPIQAEEPGVRGAYKWKGKVFARSRRQAYDKMRPHEKAYQELSDAVREVWRKKITPADEEATFEAMAAWFDRRARPRGPSDEIRLLLEADIEYVLQRVERHQTTPG